MILKSEKLSRKLQRVLITGGAGFIGSHTVDLLLSQGKEVVVLDNLSSGSTDNLNLQHPGLEFIEGDILEFPLLKDLIAGCDAVLHLAAIVSVPLTIENPFLSLQVNTQGFLHVLQAVAQVNPAIRVVQASSAAVYGNTQALPCHEEQSLAAVSLSHYALQKIHAEEYANLYAHLYGIPSLALRYFNVYGPRQSLHSSYSGVISRFIQAFKQAQPLTIYGDGLQSRDFIHVYDIAKANVLALQSNYTSVLNIATGQASTLMQLIDYLVSAAGKAPQIQFNPPRIGDIQESYAAVELAAAQLGFVAGISLPVGMKMMWQ